MFNKLGELSLIATSSFYLQLVFNSHQIQNKTRFPVKLGFNWDSGSASDHVFGCSWGISGLP